MPHPRWTWQVSDRPTLQTAADAPAILEALARATWAKARDGAECPPDQIPTYADLAGHSFPFATVQEAVAASSAAVGGAPLSLDTINPARTDGAPAPLVPGGFALYWAWLPVSTGRPDLAPAPDPERIESTIEVVHAPWRMMPEPRPRHPLAPLVAAWQRRDVNVTADLRPRAILPEPLRDARRERADQLPFGLDLASPLGSLRPAEQPLLPFDELGAPSAIVPVLPLALYDLAGGAMQTRGRGAPVAQRLFFEVLMSVGRLDRAPGQTARVEVTYRDLVRWLWPNLHGRAWDRRRHLPALYRALLELDGNMRIEVDRQLWRMVGVLALPTAATRPDDPATFRVEHLPGSGHGPMIDRDALRRWGLASAPAWRSFLRLAYVWDKAKATNNGARIYATRPVVARGPGGVILGADDKPLRDRRRAVVTDWSDRRAVRLGADGKPAGAGNPPAYERNPAADRVPALGPDDLIRLAFDGDLDTNRRKRLHLARKVAAAFEADGSVVVEADGEGLRLIERRPDEA